MTGAARFLLVIAGLCLLAGVPALAGFYLVLLAVFW